MAVTQKMKLIYMGTPHFAVPTLQALINAGHEIVAVYTAPPKPAGRGQKESITPVHALARAHNLTVLTPSTLKDAAAQEAFAAHQADAAVVAAYGLLLPPAILNGTKLGCLNVHPSLLPRWRGAAPIQRTIMAGDNKTAIVIMQMNEGLDTGDMLMTRNYDIPDGMNAGELHDMLARDAGELVLATLQGLAADAITAVKQNDVGVTYAKKITKEEARIDWKKSAKEIRRQILGLAPHPGAHFMYKGEAIKILDADIYPPGQLFSAFAPGTVVDNHLTIACGDGALSPMTIQRPGKKPMQVREMLLGYAISDGTVLE